MTVTKDCRITTVESRRDFDAAVVLFREYESWARSCPCFSGFEKELAEISSRYSGQHGALWLVRDRNDNARGVVGLSFQKDAVAELRRLWVSPAGRGQGLGEALVSIALAEARARSSKVVLETVPEQMVSAIRLYEDLGFLPLPRKEGETLRMEMVFSPQP
ncbi:GNAT family N-acetyltransferase [Kiloniella laminariae]|uniref:GNAT family N-acetyltransferase n=1 Tax=Kiloniella laminariae TaxID=454162 RepID=A0ABT4LI72_9PROT|nr:GNAT family N-acetyltransferase [Kiloniella laminariae]MCZ4280799.1 GNAT family N-acetyltransferase [Kiloniella laminariae]